MIEHNFTPSSMIKHNVTQSSLIEHNVRPRKKILTIPTIPTIPKILLISYDEKGKEYVFNKNKISNIEKLSKGIQEADLVICCTQDSIGRGDAHFQHYFKEMMPDNNYSLISKADATKSFSFGNTYNVKTRVYGNAGLFVELKEDKINKSKFMSDNETQSFIFNEKFKRPINKFFVFNEKFKRPIDKFFVESISFKRITGHKEGVGVITYYIKIGKLLSNSSEPEYFQYIFCNYTQTSSKVTESDKIKKMEQINKITKEKCPLEIYLITKNKIKLGEFKNNNIPNFSNFNITANRKKNFSELNIKNINKNKIIIIDANTKKLSTKVNMTQYDNKKAVETGTYQINNKSGNIELTNFPSSPVVH